MNRKPLGKTIVSALVILVFFVLTIVVLVMNTPRVPPEAPQPIAVVAQATPTAVDTPARNPTKEAQLLLEQQQKENARKIPEPSLTDVARKRPRQPLNAVIETGIFKPIPGSAPAGSGAIVQMRPPFSNDQYHIENTWYSDSNNGTRRTFVFAGNVAGPGGGDTDQGVVIVQNLQYTMVDGSPVLKTLEMRAYTSTVSTGSLHVTGADSSGPNLQTISGAAIHFDLSSRTFTRK